MTQKELDLLSWRVFTMTREGCFAIVSAMFYHDAEAFRYAAQRQYDFPMMPICTVVEDMTHTVKPPNK